MRGSTRAASVAVCLFSVLVSHARAQTDRPSAPSEDVEPRIVGTTGTTTIGIAGYVDRFMSSERTLPTHYTVQIDVGRFLTAKLLVRGGVAGSGRYGGDDADELATGAGAPAVHALGGLAWYFTPGSIWSIYSGADYAARLTQRADRDAGSIIGRLGLHGAVSSRAGIFLEGGYGLGLTSDEDEGRLRRFLGQVGVRLKL